MAVDTMEEWGTEERQDAEKSQEYQPGELAPAIVTGQKVWKPDDLKKEDGALIGTLTDLVETCAIADEAARRFSVLQTWEARHFDRGYQHLEEGEKGGWRIAGTNVGKNQNSLKAGDDANLYPTNIYSAQGDILTSALCRGEIKVNFTPAKNKEPRDVQCADEANKYKHIWEDVNNSIELQRSTVGLAWTDPRGIFWTRSVADKSRFGLVEDADDVKVVEITTVHGALETKLPMMADRLDQCAYAEIFEEVDYTVARSSYPWMGDKIKPSWGTFGNMEFERIARMNTRLGLYGKYLIGTSGIRETTMGYMWFRPGMYRDDKITASQREWLLTNFPDGLFVVMAGMELCCCWNESMDDHLSLGMFTRGFGQNRRALGTSDIPIQKRINIFADLWDKFVRGAIAIGLLETRAFDAEAIAKLESSTTRFVEVALDDGQTMDQVVGQTPTPSPVEGFTALFQWYVGPLMQSIDGATPALFGSGEGSDNTVGATQIRLQQALERIGTAWIVTNKLFEQAVGQAVKCCAENGNTEIFQTVAGYGDISVDPANLKGNFRCHAETINSIPESGAQREAKVLSILDMANANPEMAALVGTPSNAREIVKALHIEDVLTIDEANSEDKQLEEIEVMLDSEPNLNSQWVELTKQFEQLNEMHEQAKQIALQAVKGGDQLNDEIRQTGEAMEQQVEAIEKQIDETPKYFPSVPVAQDDSEDHATEAATCFAWMQEPDGRTLRKAAGKEQEGGKDWKKWTNVFLHWKGHKEMATKLAMDKQQPITPKMNISVPLAKLTGPAATSVLQKAGIQVALENAQGEGEQQTETIQRTPYSEVKQRVKRRL